MPQRDPARPQAVYQEVLRAAECDSIACVRDTTEADLFEVNKHMIISLTPPGVGGEAVGPGLGFTPVVDGEYIQDLPYVLYKEGRYHKEVEQVISGNLINEGTTTAPEDPMPDYFPEYVRAVAPGVNDTTIELIQSLYEYPPDMPERLAWDFTTDMVFACNAYNAAKAYSCDAQRYTMSIPPATHGLDQSCMPFNSLTPALSRSLKGVKYLTNILQQISSSTTTRQPLLKAFRLPASSKSAFVALSLALRTPRSSLT